MSAMDDQRSDEIAKAERALGDSMARVEAACAAYAQAIEQRLDALGDDAQLANVDLQNILQKQQQTVQMMSNISKMLHDTAMSVIRKIGG
jgi:hypothetical protein